MSLSCRAEGWDAPRPLHVSAPPPDTALRRDGASDRYSAGSCPGTTRRRASPASATIESGGIVVGVSARHRDAQRGHGAKVCPGSAPTGDRLRDREVAAPVQRSPVRRPRGRRRSDPGSASDSRWRWRRCATLAIQGESRLRDERYARVFSEEPTQRSQGRWRAAGRRPAPRPYSPRVETAARANGSTGPAPCSRSRDPATVSVQRESTRSSTSSTGPDRTSDARTPNR